MYKQLKLFDLPYSKSYQYHDYILLDQNKYTYNILMNYDWNCFILYGKSGSGKTHLAHIWQKLKNASFINQEPIAKTMHIIHNSNAFIIEDIDKIKDEPWILHCYNYARENNKLLLMTSSISPKSLNCNLKDLKSRILSAISGGLANPNEELLKIMLIKLFTDHQLHINLKIINYILNNTERSFKNLRNIVSCIDKELSNKINGITISFIKWIIKKNA
ncbi:chromosomal DNA replication initiator [Neoehrlichia mikurensis]|uniref:Chromosomal DNA replication initiator n=1 Tax=Neoehrlichia mikurensis TaxID=89586 RepID=A0A9Q9BX80_9RICK|nr:DnaA/Hda family protein [Neoehrlichia mikurensis]QXK92143.1 chromosomal DNA replication initiator [Neoehrlichia mikurensis]QXK92600.1 chromosomal DNA replication initiator [Neoehrlichia mikurensis]QXK93837.1 chromosomal DNA replication initiator [Neoehrlichia mikurensis]UTO55168.1 chromosomal DNA replication initiator [Neoehrlichia mikurensis]UTO56088.1 chromosomal DNA replication initiator [Neoehrlichia mikurensis]